MAAPSPTDLQDATLRTTILVNGSAIKDTYPLVSIQIRHELNRISWAEVVFIDGDITNSDFPISDSDDLIPGNPISISAGYGDDAESTIFSGVIVKQALEINENGDYHLVVTAKHKAVSMTFNRTEAEFASKADSDILTAIIGNYSLSSSVSSTSYQQEAMFQKLATDWDFILARAEFLGFVVALDGDNDISIAAPEVSGTAVLNVTFGQSIIAFRAELNAERQLPGVTINSWDIKSLAQASSSGTEPSVNSQGNLSGKSLSTKLSQTALNISSGTPMDKAESKLWADAFFLRMRLAALRGEVTFTGSALAKTGKLLELAGVGERYNGDAYISAVSHTLEDGRWETTVKFGLEDKKVAERADVSYPPAFGTLPAIQGLQVATVKKLTEDPASAYRIQLNIPSVSTGTGVWARMANFYATNNAGSVFLPEIGDEVVIGYLESDPRYPVILGSLYSSTNVNPNPAADGNNTKALTTRSQLKITFDDDKKVITITTPGNNTITLSDDAKSITLVDQNSNKVEMTSSGINIQSAKDITLKATGNINLNATQKVSVTATQDVEITGMNVKATANVGFTAQGSATAEVSASGQTTIKGAMVMIN
ncbi:type VI secretion system tip protein VgrG [Mucilaginibacter sp. RS28]|uniref:Type VI secretion system tip protein VgrG n=1 Tax=Mucilaginibacter straminoryzae TaxID=2932774 RepID=A0A9X1X0E2_9SPHI|nr:type VI secretion system tip protein VgrG [Mucilaginibacter straminoryzae]MCJ8208326.1 type VI secretion system tip protein VgrG [Mucilaginibacter straminoryzae]